MHARELACRVAAALPAETTAVIHGDGTTAVLTVRRRSAIGCEPSRMVRLALDYRELRSAGRLAYEVMRDLDALMAPAALVAGDAA